MRYLHICKLLAMASLALASYSLYGKIDIRHAEWGVYSSWKDVTNIIREKLREHGGDHLTLSNESVGVSKEIWPSAARASWQTKLFGRGGGPLWGTNKTLKIQYFDGEVEKSVEVHQGSPLNLVSAPADRPRPEHKLENESKDKKVLIPITPLTRRLTVEECHKLVELLSANDGDERTIARKLMLNMPKIYGMLSLVAGESIFNSRYAPFQWFSPEGLGSNVAALKALQNTSSYDVYCKLVRMSLDPKHIYYKYDVKAVLKSDGFNSIEDFLKFKVKAVDEYVPTIFEKWRTFHKRYVKDYGFRKIFEYDVRDEYSKRCRPNYFLSGISQLSGLDVTDLQN